MRAGTLLFPTLREAPAEAQIASHSLMLRAALIRMLASGLYTYMPLGTRSLQKITNIIREEMNNAGGQEFIFPILLPKELLTPSGRWEIFRQELFRLKDRHGSDHALGATHEEAFTELVGREVRSYRQLPINLYQIHTKFRDEIRPRFGVMRSREFIMKDAYSFHADDASLDATYNTMSETYRKIFKRVGLDVVSVKADSGAMGGSGSEEFMVLCDVGEEEIISCTDCDYRANAEKAECKSEYRSEEPAQSVAKAATPNVSTIKALEEFFKVEASKFIKTLIYQREDKSHAAVLIRGDLDVNETKLANYFGGETPVLADDKAVREITGARTGFAGPVGMKKKIPIIADNSIKTVFNGITGANEDDAHLTNVNLTRDFTPDAFVDLRLVKAGDNCIQCGGKLKSNRGLELGHVFKLGKKYTEAFKVTVLDEANKDIVPTMGCYGIGVNRTLAAVIEQHHDEKGIVFPISVAPFEVSIALLDTDGAIREAAERIYNELRAAGADVLLDDRNERPGVKFNDADLIGIPIRITVGKRGIAAGTVELKLRREKDKADVPVADIVARTLELRKKLFQELS
ncbi:MAG: proline--tRNA ligase [Spirochaetes bacterium]|nr:proline--tRNA ligase [Spirochaetota bacterium]